MNPRIVHVSPWDLTTGGMQRMLDLWCHREAARWDVHIVAQGLRGSFPFPGATVHAQVSAEDAHALLDKLAPDLLVHHGPASDYGRHALCPVVWIVHGNLPLRAPAPAWCQPRTVFVNMIPSDLDPSWRSLPLSVLPIAVDTELFRPAPRELVCGIVGRLSPEKVPWPFVQRLAESRPAGWRFRFIGEGVRNSYQPRVRALLGPLGWVEFAGGVAPEKVADAMRCLDAVMVPTDAAWGETACYTALEAMACGVPVVARDVEGLRATCRDAAIYGRSDGELLSCLAQLREESERARLGELARQSALARPGLAAHARRHSEAFEAAIGLPVPAVAILMAVYNGYRRHLREAWESIRAQAFADWELILVDDGSTAASVRQEVDLIARDARVRLVRLPENRGLPAALNAGLRECRAELVARMDADDVMLADRLARQVAHMRAHPEVDILGAQIAMFRDGTGEAVRNRWTDALGRTRHPATISAETIAAQARTGNIWLLNHPTVIFRRAAIERIGGYRAEFSVAQDLDLWLRANRAGLAMANLPDVLVRYRVHGAQMTRRHDLARRGNVARILAEQRG